MVNENKLQIYIFLAICGHILAVTMGSIKRIVSRDYGDYAGLSHTTVLQIICLSL